MAKYPIGIQDFSTIRNGGYVYVDKTHLIPLVVEGGKYLFLSRPRRFGKSLFLSTLEYFFLGERELFKGLSVDSYEWDWENYPIIHLDLNGADFTAPEAIDQRLSQALYEIERKYALESPKELSNPERLRSLITRLYEKTGKPVVVLVDEYEKPVSDNLDQPELLEKNRDKLRGFYAVLKSMDKYLQLVFLTGVTKFGQMTVFSGLNNIRDISLNPDYGSICGVTEEELLSTFTEGIENLAAKRGIGKEEAVKLLKYNYDGYHFSEECPDIYNPYSLINAFADKKISSYWALTGTPSLLAKILKEKNFDPEKLDGAKADEKRLMGVNNQINDPVALFYQTGYLTIKSYNPDTELFTLGYPNHEVEQAFFDYLLPNYSGLNVMETSSFIDQLRDFLENGEARKAMEVLEEFSAGISYDVIPLAETERHFQYLIYIVSKLLLARKNFVKVEEKTSDGRIDLMIATNDFVYIIEIKIDGTKEKALQQIKDKDYALQFRNDEREVFIIGMNFSSELRRIEGFLIERYRGREGEG